MEERKKGWRKVVQERKREETDMNRCHSEQWRSGSKLKWPFLSLSLSHSHSPILSLFHFLTHRLSLSLSYAHPFSGTRTRTRTHAFQRQSPPHMRWHVGLHLHDHNCSWMSRIRISIFKQRGLFHLIASPICQPLFMVDFFLSKMTKEEFVVRCCNNTGCNFFLLQPITFCRSQGWPWRPSRKI